MNNVIKLTEKLISIPSYVNKNKNESKLAKFLYSYLRKNYRWLQVEKQYVSKDRFNIIARDKYPTKLLINGHIDTVQPQSGWNTTPCKALRKGNRIFGLGSSDMKGSIAALLSALSTLKKTRGLFLLLYIDEEYDFLGMKKFVQSIKNRNNFNPSLTISMDGENLELKSGCRGCIEINLILRGMSGHSSNPRNGNNIIFRATELVRILDTSLQKYRDPKLGETTTNFAYMRAGINSNIDINKPSWEREGNIIPDFADITIEVRSSRKDINASFILKQIKKIALLLNISVLSQKVRHDLGVWTPIDKKNTFKSIFNNNNIDWKTDTEKFSGYLDVQMLTKIIKCPMYTIGPGNDSAHSSNEYIDIPVLKKSVNLYRDLMTSLCT